MVAVILGRLTRGARALFSRNRVEREMDAEMRMHIEFEADDLVARGWERTEAERVARVRFGRVPAVREAALEARSLAWVDDFARDMRHAFRQIKRAPWVTAVAVSSLGLGIGAVSLVFSIVNSATIRTIPYRNAAQLVALTDAAAAAQAFSYLRREEADYLRLHASWLGEIAFFSERPGTITKPGPALAVRITGIDDALFDALGEDVARGRRMTGAEIARAARVALISDSLWAQLFARRDAAIGASIVVSGEPRTVVGVMPRPFRFHLRSDVWVPLARDTSPVSAIARLARGVERQELARRLRQASDSLTRAVPRRARPVSLTIRDEIVPRNVRLIMPLPSVFFAATSMVLLLACASAANLLVARAISRRGEMGLRASLGATRARLIRQFLAEASTLGVAAGVLGVLLTTVGLRVFVSVIPKQGLPGWLVFGVDANILAFATALTLLVVLSIGIIPALQATQPDLRGIINASASSSVTDAPSVRAGRRLVVFQMAFSLPLLISSGLLVQRYVQLTREASQASSDMIVRVRPVRADPRYSSGESREGFARSLAARLAREPAVAAVAMQSDLVGFPAPEAGGAGKPILLGDGREAWHLFAAADRRAALDAQVVNPATSFYSVDDAFAKATVRRVLAGRFFTAGDSAGEPLVAVISQRLARHVAPGSTALGEHLTIGARGPEFVVVGVLSDAHRAVGGRDGIGIVAEPEVFFSEGQTLARNPRIILRAASNSDSLKSAVVKAWSAQDAESPPPTTLRTDAEEAEGTIIIFQIFGSALGGAAIVSLLLAAIGIYGITAYSVTRRTREIGIRIAVGASSSQIVRLMTAEGVRLVIMGLVVGLVLAAGLMQLLLRFIGQVSPSQALAVAFLVVFFAGTAIMACAVPALRAAHLHPRVALDAE
jgi:predicted permease